MSILQKLFNFLLIFSLLKEFRTNGSNITDDKFMNISEKTESNKTVIPAGVQKFSDSDLVEIFTNNTQSLENTNNTTHEIKVNDIKTLRKSRDISNGTVTFGIDCYTCQGNSTSRETSNCFTGISMPLKKCSDAEHCFVELNPLYIRRGCVLPGRVNRTFICKCPLCNDKPSFDVSHYEYKKLNDWEYDNARLQMPLSDTELMCKVCETKGSNPSSDKNCRYGKNADYMVCARQQLCYTNIDDETDFVSRGCIAKPLYNSIFFFCNNTECNIESYGNPGEYLRLRREHQFLKDEMPIKPKRRRSSDSEICSVHPYSLVMIIWTWIYYFL